MGIKGLHGLLKSIQRPCNLKKFSGQTLGVDAYGWLHRGTVACAVDLVLDRPTRKHIDFVLNRVRMLLYFGVTPYLVFDGDNLPSKSGTEEDRHRRRQESKALGLELQRKGRMPEAYQEFQKAVDVTPYMARQLIEELKKMDVKYVVAPYEADAQLVYLEHQGTIHGIISEDSDLLVFGAKRLLSKLDQHGDCIEINRAEFTACREVSLVGWTDANFRHMCILSGCDYLANIPKMGLKTAYRSIRKHKTVERALRMLQFEGNYQVPRDYLANFKQAELTFLYQRVFCPKAGKLVTLSPPDNDVNLDDLPFIGGDVAPDIAAGVACGDLDPTTKVLIEVKPVVAGKLPLGVQRRQTLGSELKPNKPINSFFTPKRTPLAELDPNSLTPSPSQQRLLERNANSSWQANSAPFRSNSASRSGPLRAFSDNQGLSPMVRSVERPSFLAQAARASTLQSTKRQRLCSDADDDSLPARPTLRSHFFEQSPGQSSPSGQKVSRTKKQRKSTMGVFSDEVAEDIFAGIPDPTEENEPVDVRDESKLQTSETNDETAEPPATDPVDDDSSAAGLANDAEKVSDAGPDSPSFNRALEYHVTRQNSTILSKYTFQSKPQPSLPVSRAAPSKIPVPQSSRRGPVPITRRPTAQRQRLTPLQRMGQAALTRSNTINLPTKLREADSAEPPTAPPTPPQKASSFTVGYGAQGSEDLIVPDSEDDDTEDTTRGPAHLDLQRFSFVAQ